MPREIRSILDMPREQLAKCKYFDLENLSIAGGRISIYELPDPSHTYCIGADGAHGLNHGDFDAGVVLDATVKPVRQVAEAHGRWGEDQFDRVLYALLRYFCNAFLVGERQVLLTVMRSLIKNYGYHWMYYEKDEVKKGAPQKDVLGHFKSGGDTTIHNYRKAIRDRQVILRSLTHISEIRKFQFRPKAGEMGDDDGVHDGDLIMAAPKGKGNYDDLVNAGAYAWKGVLQMPAFLDERPKYVPGSAGDVLEHAKVFAPQKPRTEKPFRKHSSDDDD
jgi:hypothetical protein